MQIENNNLDLKIHSKSGQTKEDIIVKWATVGQLVEHLTEMVCGTISTTHNLSRLLGILYSREGSPVNLRPKEGQPQTNCNSNYDGICS